MTNDEYNTHNCRVTSFLAMTLLTNSLVRQFASYFGTNGILCGTNGIPVRRETKDVRLSTCPLVRLSAGPLDYLNVLLIFSFAILERRVFGWRPSLEAAPSSPLIRQLHCSSM